MTGAVRRRRPRRRLLPLKDRCSELYLNHLVDQPGDYVVVDCTAGAESFASGLFTRFDLTVLVCKPTRKGVGVWRQWAGYAADYDVPARGGRQQDPGRGKIFAFLREHVWRCPAHLLRARGQRCARWSRAARSAWGDLGARTPGRRSRPVAAGAADARARDWAKLSRQATEFHLRNAAAWASAAAGEDLAGQVDPGFVMGTELANATMAW